MAQTVMMHIKVNKTFWSLGLALAVVFGSFGYMAADNQPPYEYDAEHSYIIPSPAKDGDQITVMWKLKKINRVCPGTNRRILFDKKSGLILAEYDIMPAAISSSIENGYLNRTFSLPRGLLPPGEIGYRATICYSCNLFQKFVKPLCVATPALSFRLD